MAAILGWFPEAGSKASRQEGGSSELWALRKKGPFAFIIGPYTHLSTLVNPEDLYNQNVHQRAYINEKTHIAVGLLLW